jgi:hypothetical protein
MGKVSDVVAEVAVAVGIVLGEVSSPSTSSFSLSHYTSLLVQKEHLRLSLLTFRRWG